jgi:hypothetical protein
VISRAYQLADSDIRLACHLAEWAYLADPDSGAAQECFLKIFQRRRDGEQSLMGKLAFSEPQRWVAARSSTDIRDGR